jgi:TorA maturation chaperone TorD
MTPYELALARRRTYHLFGRLFLQGVTAETQPLLQAVPQFAEAIEFFDQDQAAAEHYQLTAVSVFPYESIFRDPSGLLGGPVSDQIVDIYGQNGYEVLSDTDHIGHELLFMAHLCAAEAAALVEGGENDAALWQSRQQTFLSTHLLAWLAPLVVAIEQSGSDFYGRLANLTIDLAADHLGTVPSAPSSIALPSAPEITAEDSGLKDIARGLTTPPYSGLFLSRDAISALARRHEIPRGFGDRAQMLTNLLRTAGQYDLASDVFLDLAAVCVEWREQYEEQQARYPEIAPWIRPWHEHVSQTAESLQGLTAVLEDAPPQNA